MKKSDKDSKSGVKTNEITEKSTNKRRKFLAGITTGAAAAGVASTGNWVKPVVDNVILPAHAQTSSVMRIEGRIEEADEFSGYDGVVYNDGTHTLVQGNDDDASFNNFVQEYSALFQPVQGQSVSVNLDITADVVGPGDVSFDGAVSQTSSANTPVDGAMRASFSPVDVDLDGGTDASVVTVRGTIQADGYATRRITYTLRS